jgi:hypothetical protein
MKTRLVLAVLCIGLSAGSALAADGVVGVGLEHCAEFTKKLAATPALTDQTYFPWAEGYMSGVNGVFIANRKAYRELARDPAGQKKTLTDFCAYNPKSTILDAVIALYQARPIAQ